MRTGRRSRAALLLFPLLAWGCAQTLPVQQASNANVLAISAAGTSKLAAGSFTAEPGKEAVLNNLNVRASRLDPPNKGTFVEYIHDAIVTDLQQSGRFDPNSPIVVSGVLQKNFIDASSANTAVAEIAVRFKVERDRRLVFDKVLTERHEWESSFLGAIAIPDAVRNYQTTVDRLTNALFRDSDFRQVTQ